MYTVEALLETIELKVVSLRGLPVSGPDKEHEFYTVAPSILTCNWPVPLRDYPYKIMF